MTANGMEVTAGQVTTAMICPGIAMIIGLFIALLVTYRKDRVAKKVGEVEVQDIDMSESITETKAVTWNLSHTFTVIAIVVALALQLIADSLDRKSTRLNSSHVAISYAV